MIDIHPKVALLTALRSTDRPIAFLVGSALSVDLSGGVPGVSDMLKFVRDEIAAKAPTECGRYDADLSGATPADKYQTGMRWLQGNLGQDAVNRVIQRAVLKARKSGAASHFVGDGVAGDWMLPRGTRDLAKLVVTQNEKFTGPILTTNFDPLLSLAIEGSGGRASIRVLDSDGSAGRSVEAQPGHVQIVHLHGYWRESDTLHTATQLTSPRPKLKASLQNLLRAHTLVVAAYAGWDDVFTDALAGLLDDDEAKVNIVWCFYESDPSAIASRYARLISRIQPAIRRGRFIAYGGIDCHSIFSDLCAPSVSVASTAKAAKSPIPGWDLVDPAYLAALKPLSQEQVVRYFDGAVPTWRHAVSDAIPRREVVKMLAKWPSQLTDLADVGSMQLITAAGGEGKTTVLLQAAADFVRSGDWTVLWRASPEATLTPADLSRLATDTQWLIVADDADSAARDLAACARSMHGAGQANVDFLLAARDTDWRAVRAHEAPWRQWLKVQPEIMLRHVSAEDAQLIVDAWGRFGPQGLGKLAEIDGLESRTTALLLASKEAATRRGDGSLFGGLLAVRFDDAGLLTHVRELLIHLRDIHIEGSANNLLDAAVYIAVCHAVGIAGIHEAVLADLLSVPRERIQTRVVRPLGEESIAVRSAGCIVTRHTRVAMAIVTEAHSTFGMDLAEIWSTLVRHTVRTDREQRLPMFWFSKVVHAGPRLRDDLPKSIPENDRTAAGLSAARTALECKPEWLACVVGLGNAYRLAGQYDDAIDVFRDHLKDAPTKVDYEDVIRGYWHEWGVAEGSTGKHGTNHGADAWVQGLSVSDHFRPITITMDRAKRTFAGLGVAFSKLATSQPSCPFALARRAVAYLGRLTRSDSKSLSYFERYDKDADRIGTPRPKDSAEAIGWLAAGIVSAGRLVEDPVLKGLADPNRVSFEGLRGLLGTAN
ncbi:SIR2 family protein [Acidovorax sp. Leaf78]|uniref:P-loop NTPase n=1 Tax=unclassified Acidovorax TaxID=2684926 RepID=UPI0006F53F22|nr:SIR2 family protein [Acidovorax sp. Leaf78]KQO24593.1 hypothetical protein ASF16_23195 [Acidovorax sp. Leaf78]